LCRGSYSAMIGDVVRLFAALIVLCIAVIYVCIAMLGRSMSWTGSSHLLFVWGGVLLISGWVALDSAYRLA
jgi:hypothetical protein